MSYAIKHLMSDEKIIHQTKLSWIKYIKGVILLFIGLLSSFSSSVAGGSFTVGFSIIFIGLLLLGYTYLKVSTSEFVLTDKRVLIKVGIFKITSLELMLNKIEGIQVKQGIIGQAVNCGSLVITGTGGTNSSFSVIDKPYEFRAAVNDRISKINENNKA